MPRSTPAHRLQPSLVIAVLALLAGLVAVPQASAGTYRVWSCNTPAGKPTSVEGWVASTGATYSSTGNNCGTPGRGLDMLFGFANGVTYSGGQNVNWQFTAPGGTSVRSVGFERSKSTVSNGADLQAGAGAAVYRGDFLYDGDHLISTCLTSYACTGANDDRVAFDAGGQTKFGFDAGCFGPPNDPNVHCAGADGGRAYHSARAIEINLNDDSSPTASEPGGTLLDAGPRSGIETLTFKSSDVGGGVWQAEVKLGDAVVLPRTTIDDNGGRCAEVNVDPAVANEFGFPVPCRTSTVTANLAVQTLGVFNGTYLLTATVFDVAGNATTVVSRKVTVDNGAAGIPGAGAPNGSGGNPATGDLVLTSKQAKVTTHYGGKIDLAGRLVDAAGTPITGAKVDVYERLELQGAANTLVGSVTTDGLGAFTYRPKTRASRTVEFAFAERQGLTTYRDTLGVPISVSAAVSLKINRKTARPRQLVRFSGKVRVDPFPAKGVRVAIEVRTGKKKWQVAKNVRARKAGAFSWSYRFRNRGPYQFRARVLGAGDLAARPAATAVKRLRVR